MDWHHSYKGFVVTATQSRSPRLRRGAVRLRPWNGDLSLLRGTHHDPYLSRPKVQSEQRCCFQCSAPCSSLSRSESRPLTTARRPLSSPATAGLFLAHWPSGSDCFAFQRSNQTATARDTPTAKPAPISTTPTSTGINTTCCCPRSSDKTDQHGKGCVIEPRRY